MDSWIATVVKQIIIVVAMFISLNNYSSISIDKIQGHQTKKFQIERKNENSFTAEITHFSRRRQISPMSSLS